jgi:hypothetical protein
MNRGNLILLIFSMAIISCEKSGENAGEQKTIAAQPVTAVQLFRDYHANEVSADSKYKGQQLLVTGRVAKIRKDFTDDIVLDLMTPNQFMSAMAQIQKQDHSAAANLKRGQEVVVLCKGQGLMLGSPMLENCRIFDKTRDTINGEPIKSGQK